MIYSPFDVPAESDALRSGIILAHRMIAATQEDSNAAHSWTIESLVSTTQNRLELLIGTFLIRTPKSW